MGTMAERGSFCAREHFRMGTTTVGSGSGSVASSSSVAPTTLGATIASLVPSSDDSSSEPE